MTNQRHTISRTEFYTDPRFEGWEVMIEEEAEIEAVMKEARSRSADGELDLLWDILDVWGVY